MGIPRDGTGVKYCQRAAIKPAGKKQEQPKLAASGGGLIW